MEEVAINPTTEPPELTRTRETDFRREQSLVHTRTQERGAVILQETDPDLSASVQESEAEPWVGSGLLQGRGHSVQQCLHGTF